MIVLGAFAVTGLLLAAEGLSGLATLYRSRVRAPPGWTAVDSKEEGWMFFRKKKPVHCIVCSKAIAPTERRFVEKNRVTKEERHTHVTCRKTDH